MTPAGLLSCRRLLGWAPRPREDTLVETAESLLKLGLLKDSKQGS